MNIHMLLRRKLVEWLCSMLAIIPTISFAVTYPPTHYQIHGRYLSVNGSKIWVEKYGSGSPAVILINGAGDTIREWNNIIPKLAETTTVIGYDRPGLGNSGPLLDYKQAVTAEKVSSDLEAIVTQLKLSPPYILVGHSIGGLYISYFARKHPKQIAGIVTIDGNTVAQVFMNTLNISNMPSGTAQEIQKLIQSGEARNKKLQAEIQDLLSKPSPTVQDYQTVAYYQEVLGKSESALQIEKLGTLPKIPLIALSESSNNNLDDQIWQATIQSFADQAPCGIVKIVPNTAHYIQIDQPQYVIDAINTVVSSARNNSSLCNMKINWAPPQTKGHFNKG